MNDDLERAAQAVREAQRIAAFTGAGISAESGIPTYRGEGGMWSKYDPDKYANIHYFQQDPSYYWNFFKEVRYPVLAEAKPNEAHFVLARLEAAGKLKAVITQNIDGLHQEAGSRKVIELHGNTRRFVCTGCRKEYSLEAVHGLLQSALPPCCQACGEVIRPDVVLFGEALPPRALQEAMQQAQDCDLMLSVGSSLVVYPAAQVPVMAKEAGATLIIVNLGETPLDRIADFTFDAKAGETLSRLEAGLGGA